MTAQILDGTKTAARLRSDIAAAIRAENLNPGLAVVLVGEDAASQVYVRNKARAAEETGIHSFAHHLPADVTQDQLLKLVGELNRDARVHGILVQLPLPKHIDKDAVIASIDPAKDVDGFHPLNAGKLALGLPCLLPCTPQGCMILLRQAVEKPAGMRALVLGCSNIVGKPMAQLLLQAQCTVTMAHSMTRDLDSECRRADIMVVATGNPKLVRGDWIKPGAVVIDVGISRIDDPAHPGKTKLVGDVDFEAAKERASAITPVPGGVGPMTIACLLNNTLETARQAKL